MFHWDLEGVSEFMVDACVLLQMDSKAHKSFFLTVDR